MDDLKNEHKELLYNRQVSIESALNNSAADNELSKQFMNLFVEVHELLSDLLLSLREAQQIHTTFAPEMKLLLVKLAAEYGQSLVDPPIQKQEEAQNSPCNDRAQSGPSVRQAAATDHFIERLTKEEFEKVPKYVRDRLAFETLEPFAAKIDAVMKKKYDLIAKPRSQVSQQDMEKIRGFRAQETDEVKGLKFFVPADLKVFGSVTFDAKTKKLLSIFVYAKKLRELRGPGPLVRYVVPKR